MYYRVKRGPRLVVLKFQPSTKRIVGCSCNLAKQQTVQLQHTLTFRIMYSHKISDVNECELHNGGCSHECENFDGGYKCLCPEELDLFLGNDQRTCKRTCAKFICIRF